MRKSVLIGLCVLLLMPAQAFWKKTNYKAWTIWVAESEMIRNPELKTVDFVPRPKWDYTQGLIARAITQLYLATGEEKYYEYVLEFADFFVNEKGDILTYRLSDYNIDRVNGGNFLFDMYAKTSDPKYRKAIELLRSQMETHPRVSEGAFWHKRVYPHQVWLDGLYMASPFLARYAQEFNQPEIFDDVVNQFIVCDKYTLDPVTGLNYHAWDESREQRWANKITGQSPHFWGRSMGWYLMAMVDVLDFLPLEHPGRPEIIRMLNRLTSSLMKYQDKKTRMWWQVTNYPGREGNYLESTSTTMYAYAMAKGASKGYLPPKYRREAERIFKGLIAHSTERKSDGTISITRACSVAGLGGNPYRDGSYEYYISELVRSDDPKGVGPFILLGLELTRK